MATKEPLYTRATVLADRGGKRRCVHVLCASAREKEMQERDLSITLLQRKEDMQEWKDRDVKERRANGEREWDCSWVKRWDKNILYG